MDAVTVTTPTASTEIHTPPAPALGFEDSYEPYSPPRKSSRLQQKRAVNRTPSPQLPSRHYSSHSLGSPRSRSKKQHHFSDLASPPPTSPQKKRMPATMDSSRRVSGSLTAESTASAAAALGLPIPSDTPSKSDTRRGRSAMARATSMLPTPAKTPQKPPTEQQRANITMISRNLFNHSDDEVMPPSKKARANHYTLDSFTADGVDEPITIFTDSHERVPEVDTSSENPFYGDHIVQAEPATRRSKRHTVSIPGEGKVSVEEAVRRSDGMLIVFRGKKQFRKFSDTESGAPSDALDDGDGGLEGAVESPLRRPLTRSAIKPRLLFPTSKDEDFGMDHDDEEAPTDIEDHVLPDTAEEVADEHDMPGTPNETAATADTPKAPRFAPVSPPTTKRTTRHGVKSGSEATPVKTSKPKSTSPFSQWPRTKSHGQKRSAESQSPGLESAKRPKA
ncbi:hypothetical protein GQ53DRAFT_389664 [Thozetella sp. PMI_491]|nr:hypothetical protein GQ53DRAFT_389664 [Thozetella sp. PMI_491]